jgi:hypothetical protein
MSRRVDPQDLGDALAEVETWLLDETCRAPDRIALGAAVRLTARLLAARAPGAGVEVRIPPFVAVQCISGPKHTRGTPPNVVETDPRTWLLLATGRMTFEQASLTGLLHLSGSRAAEISRWFPLLSHDETGKG